MANNFIAGPATVDIFLKDQLIATSKTMLDSSLNIGSSKEEIRAGAGAKLYGQYFHTSTFGINLTDVMFKLEYVAMQTGSAITTGADIYADEEVTVAAGGVITVAGTPVEVLGYGTIGWVRNVKDTSGFMQTVTFVGQNATIPTAVEGDVYCVKYMKFDGSSRQITVAANFVPDTVRLVMTATMFSGSEGEETRSGIATIEVPRFQFDGNMAISMTATGVANAPLAGMALASSVIGCDAEDYYATITETLFSADRFANVMTIALEGSDVINLAVSDTYELSVYAVPYNGSAFKVLPSEMTIVSGDTATATVSGTTITAVATGETDVTISINGKPNLTETAIVEVA